jgi:hypothetical protein
MRRGMLKKVIKKATIPQILEEIKRPWYWVIRLISILQSP